MENSSRWHEWKPTSVSAWNEIPEEIASVPYRLIANILALNLLPPVSLSVTDERQRRYFSGGQHGQITFKRMSPKWLSDDIYNQMNAIYANGKQSVACSNTNANDTRSTSYSMDLNNNRRWMQCTVERICGIGRRQVYAGYGLRRTSSYSSRHCYPTDSWAMYNSCQVTLGRQKAYGDW